MKRNAQLAVLLVTGSLLNGVSAWASGPGTTSANILKIGVGARAVGMGEAYVAQADDVSSLYWNPSGLALMQERQASFMYNKWLKDLTYQNAALGIPLENGALGASLSYLNYGSISGYDINGNAIGDQKAYSGVGTVGAAWLGNQWSLGVSAKGIQESLADEKANGVAFDVGTTLLYPKPVFDGTLRLGAVVQNMGSGMKFLEERSPFPTQWKVGLAAVQMLNKKLNVSIDYGKPRDDKATINGGVEYWLGSFLALRTGYAANHTEGQGVRAGVGLRIKKVSFDYAYAGFGDLGMTHRFELSFRFGEPRPILNAEEYKLLKQAKAAIRQERYEQAVLLLDSLIEMEPHHKQARRLVQTAMAHLEGQQKDALARQGKSYQPSAANVAAKPGLSDLDDLDQLLSLGGAKSAQAVLPDGSQLIEAPLKTWK